METVNMTIRIDKNLKASVDSLFKNLGTTTNSAIKRTCRIFTRNGRLQKWKDTQLDSFKTTDAKDLRKQSYN